MTLMMSKACSRFALMMHKDDTLPMAGTVSCRFGAALTASGAFPQAVPNFRVEVVEILAEGNTAIIQTVMSGPIPAEVPGIAGKAQVVFIPHAYFLRFNTQGKISRLDAYWDNTVLNSIKPSAV